MRPTTACSRAAARRCIAAPPKSCATERAAPSRKLIAHHFTEAGLDDLAIEWWGKAGDQALRRSAFQEAIAHLGKAIAMADKAAGGKAAGERLHLQTRLWQRAHRRRGVTARRKRSKLSPEPASSRLAKRTRPSDLRPTTALWVGSLHARRAAVRQGVRGDVAEDVAADPICPRPASPSAQSGSRVGSPESIAKRADHLERALALFQPGRDDDLAFRFGWDAGVGAMIYLALVLWPLGDVERAVSLVRDAEARIAGLSISAPCAREYARGLVRTDARRPLARCAKRRLNSRESHGEHDLPMWRAFGVFLEGSATAESRRLASGLTDMRRGAEL